MERTAQYWKSLSGGVVRCELCPHYCVIEPGLTGKCRVRKNVEGTLTTLNYGKVISYAYDPIEKKPLRFYEPGSTIFSIGTFGCNLACEFCQNHTLVNFDGPCDTINEEVLLRLAGERQSIGIAYTYNEPTIWFEFVRHMAKQIKALGLKNVLVTNGFINQAPLEALLPYIDAMNIDLKSYTDGFYQTICGGALPPVLNTIKTAAAHTHVEVTTLLIDGLNTNPDEIEAMAAWLASVDANIPLHLSRYFPNYKMSRPPTRLETMIESKRIAEKYLSHIWLGNV
ncbi:MAG: AmmeMemoRadiSam system radical SAM enzyme [Firmicutes bacterium]|nr:AmmeMemoRadiSam system radical SAM enzyme [Bacillota bacterium]